MTFQQVISTNIPTCTGGGGRVEGGLAEGGDRQSGHEAAAYTQMLDGCRLEGSCHFEPRTEARQVESLVNGTRASSGAIASLPDGILGGEMHSPVWPLHTLGIPEEGDCIPADKILLSRRGS